jgi:hypothetical protein
MGWTINTYQGRLMLSHGGSIEGYRIQMTLLPESRSGMIVLTNTSAAEYCFARTVSYRMVDQLLGTGLVDWNTRFKQARAEQQAQEEKQVRENAAKKIAGTKPAGRL